jgi:Leucine Rich repeat
VLKVNSSLSCLNLGCNSIQNEGAGAIAHTLKVNTSLTSLNLFDGFKYLKVN